MRKHRDEQLMWIFTFADVIALLVEDVANLKAATGLLDANFSGWGLNVSTTKTENLVS